MGVCGGSPSLSCLLAHDSAGFACNLDELQERNELRSIRSATGIKWSSERGPSPISMSERPSDSSSPVYDRTLLLHGSKRNEMVTLAEIEQYGLDSFGDADYVSIYGMPPREWYRHGIRLLGRTAVECTRDKFGKRVGLDVASVAARMPSNQWVVIDPFAGSCNTLFWILRQLPNSEGIAFESDP